MSDNIRRHIYISGRVQGVGFRASVRHMAQKFKVKGWVKNLYDGRVEAIFTGNKHDVKKIIEYVNKGPRFANVNNVDIHKEEYKEEFDSFFINY